MTRFTLHTPETAPDSAGHQLSQIQQAWGFIPNLHRTLAESPELLQAYDQLFTLVGKTSLSAIEQQVAFLAINYVNECEYCMAGHTALAGMAKVPAEIIAALRDGAALPDAKLDALARFAAAVTQTRGHVGDAAVDAFLAAGFSQRQVLDVILIVATKTISNYTNHITHTPTDAFMANTLWVAPSRRVAA